MLKDFAIRKGVNLGGWMSQCDYSRERLDGFITRKDLEQIASWGVDHVRLPVDYNVLETEDGKLCESGFDRVSRAVEDSREMGLKLVLDLHKTAGFSFDQGEAEEGFFGSAVLQERFYRIWENFARRFGSMEKDVAFELLNEVTSQDYIASWNRIAAECIRRIRMHAKDTLILVGSYHNNAPHAVPELDPPADSRVVYNCHCYDPLKFTHQGAPWVQGMDTSFRMPFEEAGVTEAYFENVFGPALACAEKRGTGLYCGEYGVIDRASPEDTVRWYRCIHAVFEKYGMARCAWSYKQMDFGLSDSRLDGVREELIRYL